MCAPEVVYMQGGDQLSDNQCVCESIPSIIRVLLSLMARGFCLNGRVIGKCMCAHQVVHAHVGEHYSDN